MLPINIRSEFEKYVILLILPASIKESCILKKKNCNTRSFHLTFRKNNSDSSAVMYYLINKTKNCQLNMKIKFSQ